MITINQTVINKKGQKGTITRIITKSTGYVEVSYENGTTKKEMAFNLTDENGNALKKAPKKAEPKPVSPLQAAIAAILSVNNICAGDRNNIYYQIWEERMAGIRNVAREQGNAFICDVCDKADAYMRISDKQASCVAKFAIENNIKF